MTGKPWSKLAGFFARDQKEKWDRDAASKFDPSSVVLDLGCGEGRFLRHLGEKAIGLDQNAASLEMARSICPNLIEADARQIPLDSSSVDGVHCSQLLEHFMPDDVHKILCEMNRVLKPGGVLVVRSPVLWSGFYNDLTHIRPYNPHVLLHYMTRLGQQRTLGLVPDVYEKVSLKWRHRCLRVKIGFVDRQLKRLNRWGFPWLKRTGYMLVLRKLSDEERPDDT